MHRRTLLAGLATGILGSIAGCGYRPGGGDVRWNAHYGESLDGVAFGEQNWLTVDSFDASRDFVGGEEPPSDAEDASEMIQCQIEGSVAVSDGRDRRVSYYRFDSPVIAATIDGDRAFAVLGDGTVGAVAPGGRERTEDGLFQTTEATTDDDSADGHLAWQTGEVLRGRALPSIDEARRPPADCSPDSVDLPPRTEMPVDVGGETLYVWTSSTLTGIDLANGERRFQRPFGDGIGTVVPWSDGVYLTVEDRLRALDAGGDDRWDVRVRRSDASPRILVDERGVYVVERDRIRGFDHGGSRRFRRDVSPSPAVRPAVEDGTLYYATDGSIAKLDPDGGEEWDHDVSGVQGRLAVDGGRVYATTGSVLLAIEDGTEVWWSILDHPTELQHHAGPFLVDDAIVLVGHDDVRGFWRS